MIDVTWGKAALTKMAGAAVARHIAGMVIAGSQAVVFETYGFGMTDLTESGGRRPRRVDKAAIGIEQLYIFQNQTGGNDLRFEQLPVDQAKGATAPGGNAGRGQPPLQDYLIEQTINGENGEGISGLARVVDKDQPPAGVGFVLPLPGNGTGVAAIRDAPIGVIDRIVTIGNGGLTGRRGILLNRADRPRDQIELGGFHRFPR